jgi:hypothetical protein
MPVTYLQISLSTIAPRASNSAERNPCDSVRTYVEETGGKRISQSRTGLVPPGRVQLNRLLDPDNDSVTLGTLSRAATALGRRLRLDLV